MRIMGLSIKDRLAALPPDERAAWVLQQPDWILEEMDTNAWWYTARPEQVPPNSGDWLLCCVLAGRGFGKSRAGSEWLIEQVNKHPYDKTGTPTEWLVVAETLSDARTICIEGPAGLLNALGRRKMAYRYLLSPRPRIIFPDGARIHFEGADDADVGRGHNVAGLWGDEIAKWKYSYDSWYEGILPALRTDLEDDHPRAFVTTTPKPIKLLQEWVKRKVAGDSTIHLVTGATFDNAGNLSPHMLAELKKRYDGTTIGRQELYGEILEAIEGALFSRRHLAQYRVDSPPDDLRYIVVGMDPGGTGEDDETGIVVVGATRDDHHYVLADRSLLGAGRGCALHAWHTVAEFGADVLAYESNMGKQWLAQVLSDAYMELQERGMFPQGTKAPMKAIDSRHGKKLRAEPVAMRLEQGRLHIVGELLGLENQLTGYIPDQSRDSPDRLDAMVHACRHLIGQERSKMKMSNPSTLDSQLWAPASYYVD